MHPLCHKPDCLSVWWRQELGLLQALSLWLKPQSKDPAALADLRMNHADIKMLLHTLEGLILEVIVAQKRCLQLESIAETGSNTLFTNMGSGKCPWNIAYWLYTFGQRKHAPNRTHLDSHRDIRMRNEVA